MDVKIKKLNENAVIPDFKHVGDAGKDLYATTVKYNPKYDRFEYGLGFATEIPEGYQISIRPRSTNTKKECYIPNAPGTIDSNYRGEWFVMFKLRASRDTLDKSIEEMEALIPYSLDEAIAQCFLEKVEDWKFVEVDSLSDTERGADGGLIREGK